jgi:GNAT superfamily N-acetyltransferase
VACADSVQVGTKREINLSGSSRVIHTVGMIRLGTSADLIAAASVYRRASLSNTGDRDNLLAHPEYLILRPEGLAEGRTYVAEEDGSLAGFATWVETADTVELEDLFVDPGYMRRGIGTALVNRITDVLRARGVERLEVTANPHALGFYRAVGFIECGVTETEFGAAPRMVLAISLLRRNHQVSMPQHRQLDGSPGQIWTFTQRGNV